MEKSTEYIKCTHGASKNNNDSYNISEVITNEFPYQQKFME